MLEKCLKCNTLFEVDESLITSKLKLFKCSVCENEWPFVNNKNFEKSIKAAVGVFLGMIVSGFTKALISIVFLVIYINLFLNNLSNLF